MSNDLEFETHTTPGEVQKQWGMHNGIVVLAAVGLAALSMLVQWLPQTQPFSGLPLIVFDFLSTMGFVMMIAAGSVIGMLVATRMLQSHVSDRGAARLALWGIAALVASLVLQTGLLAIRVFLQMQPTVPMDLAISLLSSLLQGTIAVGAAMVALAFVGRLRN